MGSVSGSVVMGIDASAPRTSEPLSHPTDRCDHPTTMLDRIPRRLRFAFLKPPATVEAGVDTAADHGEVDFVAYGEDCVLSGRTILDSGRLSDMLNDHEEYALIGVSVERFDDGQPLQIDDVVVARDEIFLVHASGPRGDAARRKRTTPQHLAVKMGPYEVRGFFHSQPGVDPVEAVRRRKAMVPLTKVRIEYVLHGEHREVDVDTVIMNREQVDWMIAIEPDCIDFPSAPQRLANAPKRLAAASSKRLTTRSKRLRTERA
jgi:hypothetical protein